MVAKLDILFVIWNKKEEKVGLNDVFFDFPCTVRKKVVTLRPRFGKSDASDRRRPL